jgi:hypothetical protein
MGDPPPRRPRRRLRTRGRGSPLARAGNRGQADRYPDQGPDDVVAAGMQEIKNDAQGREKWRTGKGQMGQALSPNLRLVRRRLTSGPACGIHEYDERNVSGVIAGARVISTAARPTTLTCAVSAPMRSLTTTPLRHKGGVQLRCGLRYGRRRCRAEVFRRAQAGAAAPPSLPRARRRRSPHAATATGVQRLVYLLVANKPFWHGKEISARRYRRYARCWRLPRATWGPL